MDTASRAGPFIAGTVASDADAEGLREEIAFLRNAIRELANPGEDTAEHVKILAELRHQVAALCTTLKTEKVLLGRGEHALASDLEQVLEELGDRLGVAR